MFPVCRIAGLVGSLALLAACSSTDNGRAVPDETGLTVAAAEPEGRIPDYCPRISLREGTAVLRKRSGEELEYVASIVSTSRDCRIVDGQLRMKIGVAGRLVPGPAATAGTAVLPLRIAVVRGTDVLYSAKGDQSLAMEPGVASGQFIYVDDAVVVPEPTRKDLVVYVGFDEGPMS